MLVYVLRHGIAHDRMDPDCPPDAARALTPEGTEKTREAMRGLHALRPTITHRYTSPLLRAVQTLEVATEVLGLGHTPRTVSDALLPAADPEAAAALLRHDGPEGALLAGHAPHVDALVAWLVCGPGRERTALKKAGVALLDVPERVGPGTADLLWLLPPKALRALAG